MNNLEHIKYTYKHRIIVIKLAEKYFKNNEELLEKIKYHDLDKLYLYLFYNKKDVSHIHRELSSHHENEIDKNYLDYVEMVLDWESARYTKPDKPLNAYETLIKYYPNMSDNILPILKGMDIAKENMPMDNDIILLAKELDNISNEEIINELKENINILFNKNINKSR